MEALRDATQGYSTEARHTRTRTFTHIMHACRPKKIFEINDHLGKKWRLDFSFLNNPFSLPTGIVKFLLLQSGLI